MEERKDRDRQGLVRYVHLLRFGPTGSQVPHRVFMCYKDIAKMLRMSIQQVHILVKQDPAKPDRRKVVKMGPKPLLSAQHLAYLTSPLIL